jgi:hypothetical protein
MLEGLVIPESELLRYELMQLAAEGRDLASTEGRPVSFEAACGRLHARWNEGDPFQWVNVLPNALVVSLGMMLGASHIPDSWTGPLGGRITSVVEAGVHLEIGRLADRTHRLAAEGREALLLAAAGLAGRSPKAGPDAA